MKQDQQSLESDKDATRVLTLSRNLRDTANEVVRACEALDVEALERDELDAVDLTLATPVGLERADDLVHQLASVDDELRAKLNRPLRLFFTPLRKYFEALNEFVQKQVSEQPQDAALVALARKLEVLQQQAEGLEHDFRERRDRLIDQLRSSDTSQCQSAWRALHANCIEQEALRRAAHDIANPTQHQLKFGGAFPATLRAPICPVRIGDKDAIARTLSVPLKLFLGQNIVGLCHRVSQINTNIAKLPVDAVLWGRAKIYSELYTSRDLESWRLPVDPASFNPRHLPAVQRRLELLVDALKQFLALVLKRSNNLPWAESKRRSIRKRKTSSTKVLRSKRKTANSPTGSNHIGSGNRAGEKALPSSLVVAESQEKEAPQAEPSFQVIIKSPTYVLANNNRVRRKPSRHILLALFLTKQNLASEPITFRKKWTPKFGPEAKLDFSGSAGHEKTAEL